MIDIIFQVTRHGIKFLKYNNNFNEHKENINDKYLNFKNDSTFIKFWYNCNISDYVIFNVSFNNKRK